MHQQEWAQGLHRTKKSHPKVAFLFCANRAARSGLRDGSGSSVSGALGGIGSTLGSVSCTSGGGGSTSHSGSGAGGSVRSSSNGAGSGFRNSRSGGGSRSGYRRRSLFHFATCGQGSGGDHGGQNERLVHFYDYLRVLDENCRKKSQPTRAATKEENVIPIST